MGRVVLMMLVASFVMGMGGTNAATRDEEEAGGLIYVAGKVMCQHCSKSYNEWINGDRPIKGCKVSLTCMDERRRVVYYNSDVTDDLGQYEMTLNKYINGKELKDKLCSVRLLSSPDPSCNLLTDFAGGKNGVKLFRPSYVYRDTVKYLLDTLYFTSPMCEKPDTTYESDEYPKTKY